MMKRLFLLFCLCLSSGITWAYSLVFIHIGRSLPSYAEIAIAQARLFNRQAPIYLVANATALHDAKKIAQQHKITFVAIESLHKTDIHKAYTAKCRLASFWRETSERFLCLYDFMEQYNVKDVFHLENDVMLYVNLQHDISLFQKYYSGIGAVCDSDERCIPGFVYIAHKNAMKSLASFFVKNVGRIENDMYMLGAFVRENDGQYASRLPLIMENYVQEHGLKNELGAVPQKPYAFCNHVATFNSIFDAAALGQYLGGIHSDPNRRGFINETCVFNPAKLNYEWRIDHRGRKVPYALFGGRAYRINNLHIHSKQLSDFHS